MRVSVFGLGYVGCVTAACLAHMGHKVIGVDIQPYKVAEVNAGRAPLVEPGLDKLIATHVRAGRLRATGDAAEAVQGSEIALVCVGTPSQPNGKVNLSAVERVVREIGAACAARPEPFCVVIRSTCPPGTAEQVLAPLLQQAAGREMALAVNPEFMREGSAVRDFFAPPFILIGANDTATVNALHELYAPLGMAPRVTDIRTAEAVKYASNAFHAVKVVFANEIGRWCVSQGVDSRAVMDIFCADRMLNLSEYYLKPGFAFGGSCLGKDLRALLYQAQEHGVDLPLLKAVLPSNRLHIQRALELVTASGKRRVGFVGLAFKPETDDVRESPLVLLAEQLLGMDYAVRLYDPQLSLTRVIGANRAFLEQHLPQIDSLLATSVEEVLACSELVIIGQPVMAYRRADLRGKTVIDLVGLDSADRDEPDGAIEWIRLV